MAITYVGAASAASSSVSLPSFQVGDVAIVLATNSLSSSSPSVPSGWTALAQNNTTNWASSLGYRILQSGDTTTGTWTNASVIGVIIYRGTHPIVPIDALTSSFGFTASSSPVAAASFAAAPYAGYSSSLSIQILIGNAGSNSRSLSTSGWTNRTSGLSLQYFGVQDGGSSSADYTFAASSSYCAYSFALRDVSTFPIIADQDTASGTVTSNSDNWTLTVPTNISAGDLLIGIISADGNNTNPYISFGGNVGTTTGINGSPYTSGANCLRVTGAITTGSSVTATGVIGASEQGAWIIYRIPAGSWYGGNEVGNVTATSSSATGTSTTPDPGSCNPTDWDVENTLWLAIVGVDTSRTIDNYSNWTNAGFTNFVSLVSGGSNGATLAVARLESAVASVDPGTVTISNSDDWVASTIAIRPRQYFSVVAQAQAQIKKDKAHAQAQAKINAFNINNYGQVRAYIFPGMNYKFSQAAGRIKTDTPYIDGTWHPFSTYDNTGFLTSLDYDSTNSVWGFRESPGVTNWFSADPTLSWSKSLIGISPRWYNTRELFYGNGYWITTGAITEASIIYPAIAYVAASSLPIGTWTERSSKDGNGFPNGLINIINDPAIYSNDYWVIGPNNDYIFTQATDPTGSFASNTGQPLSSIQAFAKGRSYTVGVGLSGNIMYKFGTPTGTWTSVGAQGSNHFNSVAFGNDYWVAVGNNGALYYSHPTVNPYTPDTWTSNTQGTANWKGVDYDGKYWIIVGESGNLRYTTDPSGTWVTNNQSSDYIFLGIKFANSLWIIAGGISTSATIYYAKPLPRKEFAQAQAQITSSGPTTYRSYAQSLGHIKTLNIKDYAQAMGQIKQTYLGYAQAQGHIKTIYRGYGQARSKTTGYNYGQSQAQAYITRKEGYAQAISYIKPVYTPPFTDTFTRTVVTPPGGWGTADNGDSWSVGVDDQAFFWVTLGQGRIGSASGSINSKIYLKQTGALTLTYEVKFKFSFDDLTGINKLIVYNGPDSLNSVGMGIHYESSKLYFVLDVQGETNTAEFGNFTAGESWWFKGVLFALTATYTNARAKAWKESESEPSTWTSLSVMEKINHSTFQHLTVRRIGPIYDTLIIDDLTLKIPEFQSFAQAQSLIIYGIRYSVLAQAETKIAGPYKRFAQAGARISSTNIAIRRIYLADTYYSSTSITIPIEPIDEKSLLVLSFWADLSGGTPPTISGAGRTWMAASNSYLKDDAEARIYITTWQTDASNASQVTVEWNDSNIDYIIQIWEVVNASYPILSGGISGHIDATPNDIIAVSIPEIRIQYNRVYIGVFGTTKNTATLYASDYPVLDQQSINAGVAMGVYYITDYNDLPAQEGVFVWGDINEAAIGDDYAAAFIRLDEFPIREIAQAQAQITASGIVTYYSYGQVQAKIDAFAVKSYAQSMAQIKQIYFGHGQTQSQIKQTYLGYGQALAQIKATYQGYAQTLGHIKSLNIQGYGQSQATIKAKVQKYGQALAIIYGDPYLIDDFNRSVANGWGTASTYGGDWVPIVISASDLSVDGSKGVLVQSNNTQKGVIAIRSSIYSPGYVVSFKFSVDEIPSGATGRVFLKISPGNGSSYIGLDGEWQGILIQDTSQISIAFGIGGSFNSNNAGTYTAGEEWQYVGIIIPMSNEKMRYAGKTFKIGTSEPYWQWINDAFGITYQYTPPGYVAFITESSTTFSNPPFSITLDDLKVYQISGWPVHGQAQAKINSFNTQNYGQAQSQIFAQTVSYSIYGQSQAQIKQTYLGYAYVLSTIKSTSYNFANAQGYILGSYLGYSNTQAQIKATYQSYGQAQAHIKQVYRGYAQSQAQVKQTYQGFSQAQSQIKQTYRGYGQAQAQIKQTYQGYAQAQTQIRQTYRGYGQAQGQLKQTYYGFVQAMGQIKQTYFGYAQAQATVLATSKGYAQAQSDILQTYQYYGQALGYITVTELEGFGQALATISAGSYVYAQANAWIYLPQIARPSSDTYNGDGWVGTVNNL